MVHHYDSASRRVVARHRNTRVTQVSVALLVGIDRFFDATGERHESLQKEPRENLIFSRQLDHARV